MLVDGKYLTVPIHGAPTATRWVHIVNGIVWISGWHFDQNDFFKVNRLATATA